MFSTKNYFEMYRKRGINIDTVKELIYIVKLYIILYFQNVKFSLMN